MNDQQLKQLTQQLAGIELPPEPNWWPLIWTISGSVIALLLIGLFIWQHHKPKPPQTLADEAPQRLKKIQQQWQHGQLDQRATAYQLATLLRLGLNLKQLDQHSPEHLDDQQPQWQATIQLLQQLRYQADSDLRLTDETFTTIQHWLKQGRPTC